MREIFTPLFAGRHILIVEDEYFLADEIRKKLEFFGAVIVGPTGNIAHALKLIERNPVEAAILDIHIDGGMVFPVAERLLQRNIPFVFATGYDPEVIPGRFTGYALCEKPFELNDIARALFGPQSHDTRC